MEPLRDDDPRTLGPFTLHGRLGAGGMGVVYLARTPDGTEVAVKTVPRGVGNDVRVRLQREAQLLAKIDHPRIARFVDADGEADEPWLAMRYISGPSLSDATLPLPQQQLRQLADGLAEALAALHALGVTHRDVKPGNVIMTTHGAVLVDLGIAVTADASSMTMAGTAVGSPAWMAPEQFAGDNAAPPADVWGWAAVVTYAATGREPFGSGTLAALAHRIMTGPPDLAGVPQWLVGPIQLALTKIPERRPRAADLMRGGRARVAYAGVSAALAPPQAVSRHPSGPQALAGHPSGPQQVAARPAPSRRRHGTASGGSRSRSIAWLVAASVVIAAIVVGVVLFVGGGGGSHQAGDPTGTPSSTGTKPVTASGITVALLKQDGLCTGGCSITGKVPFTHPKWGKVTLVTTQNSADGSKLGQAQVSVIDSTGASRWDYEVGPVDTFKPVANPVDNLTHLFLTYNAGRYDGIVVLAATNDTFGMTDYSSVPNGSDSSLWRFYDAAVRKVDGRYEIVVESNDCTPDCATGKVSYTTYAWNGLEYVQKS